MSASTEVRCALEVVSCGGVTVLEAGAVGWLSGSEVEEAARRGGPDCGFARARSLIREIAAQLLGIEPADVTIGRRCPRCGDTAHGAPVVDGLDVSWSVSHSMGVVVVAVGGGAVGVDVESPARLTREPVISPSFFSWAEIAQLVQLQAAARHLEVLRLWCRKEAAAKAVGVGMTVPFRTIEALDDTVVVAGVEVSMVDLPFGAACAAAVEPGRQVVAVTRTAAAAA